MNTDPLFPFALLWTPQQLTDASRLRLMMAAAFDAAALEGSANDGLFERRRHARPWHRGYAATRTAPALFRIHG